MDEKGATMGTEEMNEQRAEPITLSMEITERINLDFGVPSFSSQPQVRFIRTRAHGSTGLEGNGA
jgi:hypothetical protein